mmetsp:Transcript_121891/g.248855  ORF Transcript_121891/g.248855 Transcript_121891/m.248855 type:complete len:200 (-) Transcript_121891:50-649(-)
MTCIAHVSPVCHKNLLQLQEHPPMVQVSLKRDPTNDMHLVFKVKDPMRQLADMTRPDTSHDLLELLLNEVRNVLHILEGCGLLIWELHIESLLECHNSLHDVQGVRTELRQRRLTHDLLLLDAELFCDDVGDLGHGLRAGSRARHRHAAESGWLCSSTHESRELSQEQQSRSHDKHQAEEAGRALHLCLKNKKSGWGAG